MLAAGPDMGGNDPLFLNAVLAKCSRSQSVCLLMFVSVGGNGGVFGCFGS